MTKMINLAKSSLTNSSAFVPTLILVLCLSSITRIPESSFHEITLIKPKGNLTFKGLRNL